VSLRNERVFFFFFFFFPPTKRATEGQVEGSLEELEGLHIEDVLGYGLHLYWRT